jgi:hypothetical protein
MNNRWKEVLLRALDGEKDIPSPFYKEGVMKSVFNIVREEDRIGYMYL